MAYGRHKEAERKFKRLRPSDVIEAGGQKIEIQIIDDHLIGPSYEMAALPPTGIPISTLATLIAEGALEPGSPLFYE